jgi:hypothetical protein
MGHSLATLLHEAHLRKLGLTCRIIDFLSEGSVLLYRGGKKGLHWLYMGLAFLKRLRVLGYGRARQESDQSVLEEEMPEEEEEESDEEETREEEEVRDD